MSERMQARRSQSKQKYNLDPVSQQAFRESAKIRGQDYGITDAMRNPYSAASYPKKGGFDLTHLIPNSSQTEGKEIEFREKSEEKDIYRPRVDLDEFLVELAYIPAGGIGNHVDVVVTTAETSYGIWARATKEGFGNEVVNTISQGASYPFRTDNVSSLGDFGTIVARDETPCDRQQSSDQRQIVHYGRGSGIDMFKRFQSHFSLIQDMNIPYRVLTTNSNSTAFTVLENVLGKRPNPRFNNTPGWDINVYSNIDVAD